MSDIEKVIRACKRELKERSLYPNALHLLMQNHITDTQFHQIVYGEEIRMAEEANEMNKNSILLPIALEEDFSVPQSLIDDLRRQGLIKDCPRSYFSNVVKHCAEIIDNAIERFVPNQIDHVVIIAKREKSAQYRWDCGGFLFYKITLRLLDIKKQTAQSIGTNKLVDLSLFLDTDSERALEYFRRTTQEQFQMIVLQLIEAIKTDSLSRIGEQRCEDHI